MDEKLIEFLERDKSIKDARATGKDVYATIASKIYHNKYEDNLEWKDNTPYIEGKIRRTNAKMLVLSAFLGDTKYLEHVKSSNFLLTK